MTWLLSKEQFRLAYRIKGRVYFFKWLLVAKSGPRMLNCLKFRFGLLTAVSELFEEGSGIKRKRELP